VKSTLFIRIDIIKSENDRSILKQLAREGWEIGLHLINTDGTRSISPKDELEKLKRLTEVPIHGVTPCGSTIGWKGRDTWKIMDSLGLEYMEGYGIPNFKVNTFVIPTHLSLDIYYVRKFGEKEGYQKFKEDLLLRLRDKQFGTVLVHPEWFVRSLGSRGLKKLILTLLRKRMMNNVYNKFLSEFREKIKFVRYIDLYETFKNSFSKTV
jgi:hypothetical protein